MGPPECQQFVRASSYRLLVTFSLITFWIILKYIQPKALYLSQ